MAAMANVHPCLVPVLEGFRASADADLARAARSAQSPAREDEGDAADGGAGAAREAEDEAHAGWVYTGAIARVYKRLELCLKQALGAAVTETVAGFDPRKHWADHAKWRMDLNWFRTIVADTGGRRDAFWAAFLGEARTGAWRMFGVNLDDDDAVNLVFVVSCIRHAAVHGILDPVTLQLYRKDAPEPGTDGGAPAAAGEDVRARLLLGTLFGLAQGLAAMAGAGAGTGEAPSVSDVTTSFLEAFLTANPRDYFGVDLEGVLDRVNGEMATSEDADFFRRWCEIVSTSVCAAITTVMPPRVA